MIKRLLAATAIAAGSAAPAHAAGLELALGNDTASLTFLTESAGMGYGGADLGFGGFFNNDDDLMLTGNLLVTGTPGRNVPIQYGVGAKAFLTDLDSDRDANAIGIGGQIRYMFPTETPIGVSLEGYYAPSIVSFGDADSLLELTPRLELEVVPGTRAFVGYRLTEFDMDGGPDEELADEINVGIRLSF
jgi:hypothetical protein